MRLASALVIAGVLAAAASAAPFGPEDAAIVEAAAGLKPALKDGELKLSAPRTDLDVRLDGFPLVPSMGVASWIGFTPEGGAAVAMGDLALRETEVASVEKAVLAAGFQVTGLHNHFLRETPKMMYMHVHGMGELKDLAAASRKMLDAIGATRDASAARPPAPAKPAALDAAELETILGHKSQPADGAVKFAIGRPDVELKGEHAPVSAFLGFNTWAAFEGTPEKAAVSGDFAMLEAEVNGVVNELVRHGIEVVALHNHMLDEKPRIFFLHYWGVGPARELALGLRSALDRTGTDAAARP